MFVNVTVYPQYNNKMITEKKKKENSKRIGDVEVTEVPDNASEH
jgi:hypothetical protein